MKKVYLPLILAALMTAGVSAGFAACPAGGPYQAQRQNCAQTQKAAMPYGRGLLSAQERADFRQQMLNAKTPAERDALRAQHRKFMQERAQAQGVQAPGPGGMPRMGPGPGGGMKRVCLGGGQGTRRGARL